VGRRLTLLLLGLFVAFLAQAETLWTDTGAQGETRVHLYFFWSQSCPHCLEAHPFIEAIPKARPWVVLHALEVSRSRENAQRFEDMAQAIGQEIEGVPTFIYCGAMQVGWGGAELSGAQLLNGLDACRGSGGGLANSAGERAISLPGFGEVDPGAMSLPVFTVIIASLDAFNPCAFFVLLFLLSLLAHQKSRRRMLTVGAVFIVTSGVMYFAFMAAWLKVFHLLGALPWITLSAGLLAIIVGIINTKDFFAFEKGVTLSIPESAKPNLYRRARVVLQSGNLPAMLGATVFLAVTANFYELLCTAGFPMVFTRILTLNEPSETARYAYLALYNLIYVVPLALIVLAFVGTLSGHKLTEREGRLLKLMSGVMMLELGLVLTFAPQWLNSLGVTAVLVLVALLALFVAAWITRPDRRTSQD
jgi:hypothetical protein